MDDEELKKQQKQAEQDEASQKTAHVAGKAAATYFGGGVGAKAYDLASQTKVGQDIEKVAGKALQKQPGANKAMEGLNKSGALDAADKGLDLASGGLDTSSDALNKDGLGNLASSLSSHDSSGNEQHSDGSGMFSSLLNDVDSEEQIEEAVDSNVLDSFLKKHKSKIVSIIIPFFFIIVIIVAIIAIVYSVSDVANNFINGIVDFFTTDQQELEEDYYDKLAEIKSKIYNDDGVCIDTNLITATLTVNLSLDQALEEGENSAPSDIDEEGNEISYKKMTKQIELLANMQIRRKKYGWDNRLGSTHCIDGSEDEYELVNSENVIYFDNPAIFGENGKDSSSAELVSQHDVSEFAKFFTKKVNEEKNYAYYIYRPIYTLETVYDTNGNATYNADGTVNTKKTCDATLDKDEREEPEISIGTVTTKEDSVYYWNLVYSFIPNYYDDYLPKNEPERTEQAKKIADDIYLLYQDLGPSSACSSNSSYICRSDEGADFYGGGEQRLERKQFIENISPVAINEMTRTGIFASITLAQAALESGNGSSKLSKNYANYYGMTAGSCAPSESPSTGSGTVYQSGEGGNTCKGNSFWNGSVVAMCNSQGEDCQWYRIYDSFENSTRDHSRLLSDSYGCNVYSSYSDQLNCIVAHGYATDTNYKNKITSVINTYDLDDYDIGTWDGTNVPVTENQFDNSLCYSNGAAAGEFTSWKQYDKAWSNVKIGTSTVGRIGCAMTSVSIQIMRSGVSNTLGSSFNPGTFAEKMTSIGGFDRVGNIYWQKVEEIAPNFHYVGRVSKKATASEIANLVNQGYYVILNVKNGRHWVAVDRVEENKIYMFDPGSGGTEVGQTYGLNSIVGYAYYQKG